VPQLLVPTTNATNIRELRPNLSTRKLKALGDFFIVYLFPWVDSGQVTHAKRAAQSGVGADSFVHGKIAVFTSNYVLRKTSINETARVFGCGKRLNAEALLQGRKI
jgi:hypothetical protein